MSRIVCFHLYNDFSGSPKVLSQVIDGIIAAGEEVVIVTSNTSGALSKFERIDSVDYYTFSYQFSKNKLLTTGYFLYAQLCMFFLAVRFAFQKDTLFYVNTLMPVTAAIAGRLLRKKVICHYHENAFAKGTFYRVMSWLMQRLTTAMICVSAYQRKFLPRQHRVYIVNNSLDPNYNSKYIHKPKDIFCRNTILLLGSLKRYKGIHEYVDLAVQLPEYHFNLVVSDTDDNIQDYIRINGIVLPNNIKIYPRQSDVRPFYESSSILLNLSNKQYVIETFGLTAIEAMSFGLPVIVPTVGGIADLVVDGHNGFKIDVSNLRQIKDKIISLLSNEDLFVSMSNAAYKYSSKYTYDVMITAIREIINNTQNC